MVEVNKNDVVDKMVKVAEEFNLEAISASNLPAEQVNQMMEQVRPQLYTIQGAIYDALVEDGVIK